MLKIELVNIQDITPQNTNSIKLELADKIINKINPLFNEIYTNKQSEYKKILKQKKNITNEVDTKKQSLVSLVKEYDRKQKVKKLLERIDKIVNVGIGHSLNLKKDISFLIKVVDSLSEKKLDHYLEETMKIITKRLGK